MMVAHQRPEPGDEFRDPLDTNLSFSLLRSFVRVVDRTSVSLAARDLSLSQPTVSRHITDLERLYGTALLVRSTRSLNITSAGHRLYEAAQTILESERALTDDIDASRGKLGGPLIVSAPPSMGDVVSAFCSEFLNTHECASISLRIAKALPCLVAEGVDVAVRVGKVDDATPHVQRAATFKDVLVAQPALVDRLSAPAHPQDLKRYAWVARTAMDTSAQIRLYRHDRIEHLMVNVRLKTDQLAAHREALLAGAGAGSIEEFAVRDDIRAGRLMQLLPEWRLPTWPIQMIYAAKEPRASVRSWATAFVAYLSQSRGLPTLTKAGELMYQRAVQMINAERTLKDALNKANTVVEGNVHASAPSALGSLVVGPYCASFLANNPQTSVELRLTDAKLDLIAEGLDVTLRVGELLDSSLYAQPVTTLKDVIVAEASLAKRIRIPARPSDLTALPWVGRFGIDNAPLRMHYQNQLERVQVTPQLITDQIVNHRDLILQGAGVGVIEEYAVRQELDDGRLVQLLPQWTLPEWPVHLIFSVQKPTAVVRAWCSGLVEYMKTVKGLNITRDDSQRLAA